jgi:hypothetical protein
MNNSILNTAPGLIEVLKPIPIEVPICFVCKKQVYKVTYYPNDDGLKYIFIAECHGEKETTIIPTNLIRTSTKIGGGVAFQTKELKE